MHSALRLALAKKPGLHAAGRAAPPAQLNPGSQSKQSGTPSMSVWLAYVPGSQLAGSSRLEPVGQKLPGEQRLQAVALSALWNVPSAQSVQRGLRGRGGGGWREALSRRRRRRGVRALARCERSLESERSLEDERNAPDAGAAAVVAAGLSGNGVLTSLNMGGNEIGPTGATAIAEALQGNAVLKTIDLRENSLGTEGWCAIFAALRDNKENKIESWDLSRQGINTEIAKVLAEYVSGSGVLKNIDLSYNNLGDEGKKAIHDAVSGREGFELEM